jgi:hypothetical protein
MKLYLLTFEVKDYKIPKIVAMYLINEKEWEDIRVYLEKDFYVYLNDKNFCGTEIEISKNTLNFTLNSNIEHINAFKVLFKNYFGTYDILSILREKAFIRDEKGRVSKRNNRVDEVFGVDDDDDNEDDISYYMMTKKNTPEFSGLDDQRIMEYIKEAKKVFDEFKINNDKPK